MGRLLWTNSLYLFSTLDEGSRLLNMDVSLPIVRYF